MPPVQQGPGEQMPKETWPITRDDKVKMRDLGRKIDIFLRDYFKEEDRVHVKLVVGAFNYIMDMQRAKTTLIADDFVLLETVVKQNKLQDHIEEPFNVEPEPVPPTVAEQIAEHKAIIEKLEGEQIVAEASPAPVQAPVATIGEQPAEAPTPEFAMKVADDEPISDADAMAVINEVEKKKQATASGNTMVDPVQAPAQQAVAPTEPTQSA